MPDEVRLGAWGERVVLDQLRMAKLSSRGVRLILGEPGAGKSTLLHELIAFAGWSGWWPRKAYQTQSTGVGAGEIKR